MTGTAPSALITEQGKRVQLRLRGQYYELSHDELRVVLGLPAGPPGLGISIDQGRFEFESSADQQTIAITAEQLRRRLVKRSARRPLLLVVSRRKPRGRFLCRGSGKPVYRAIPPWAPVHVCQRSSDSALRTRAAALCARSEHALDCYGAKQENIGGMHGPKNLSSFLDQLTREEEEEVCHITPARKKIAAGSP